MCLLHLTQVHVGLTDASSRTDYVLTQDKSFKKWAKAYADDEELWFKEYVPGYLILICLVSHTHALVTPSFSAAFSKMLELGVPPNQFQSSEPWVMGDA